MADTKVTRNITLDPETDALVIAKRDELAATTGDENYSAAIRVIVREWATAPVATVKPARKAEKA
jgi:hypothetical protein